MSTEDELLLGVSNRDSTVENNNNGNTLLDDDEDALLGISSSAAADAAVAAAKSDNESDSDDDEADGETKNTKENADAPGEDDEAQSAEEAEARARRKAEKRAKKDAKKEKKRQEKERKRQKEEKDDAKRSARRRERDEEDENNRQTASRHRKAAAAAASSSAHLQQSELETTIVSESKRIKKSIQALVASKRTKSVEELAEMASSLMSFKSDLGYVKSILSELTQIAVTAKDLKESGIGLAVGTFLDEHFVNGSNDDDSEQTLQEADLLLSSEIHLLANAILQFWYHACVSEKEREQLAIPANTQIEQQQQQVEEEQQQQRSTMQTNTSSYSEVLGNNTANNHVLEEEFANVSTKVSDNTNTNEPSSLLDGVDEDEALLLGSDNNAAENSSDNHAHVETAGIDGVM